VTSSAATAELGSELLLDCQWGAGL